MSLSIVIARGQHVHHADYLCALMADAAKKRGTGIAKRSPEYLQQKMLEGKAVIALDGETAVGFCYIETWGHQRFVANSGLIVHEDYRKTGLAKAIKKRILELSQEKYPDAKVFGITTSLAVMKINSDLGYKPVTFSELTTDEKFWAGCQGCVNFDILQRTERKHCLCTGMLFDPTAEAKHQEVPAETSRWNKFLEFVKGESAKGSTGASLKKTLIKTISKNKKHEQ